MAVVKRMSSKAKVEKIEAYLKQEFKTEEKLISGMNCDSDDFSKQCELTNLLYKKNNTTSDRKYYHVIQSFSPKDNKELTHEKAHNIGKKFAEKNFKGYEVLIVTHKDKEHIHNHFVINSVGFEDGKKYRADNKSLWKLRKTSNELCMENGLVNSIQDLDKRSKNKIESGELRTALRGDKSWKLELKSQIEEVSNSVNSIIRFKEKMKEKYGVEVSERTRFSKGQKKNIYEYKVPGNEKPCGEHRLGEEYGRESIERGIIGRSQEETREYDKGSDQAEQPGRNTEDLTRAAEEQIRTNRIEQAYRTISTAATTSERIKCDIERKDREERKIMEREQRRVKERTR